LLDIYKNYNQALVKAKAGRLIVMEKFSLPKMIANYAATFKNIL